MASQRFQTKPFYLSWTGLPTCHLPTCPPCSTHPKLLFPASLLLCTLFVLSQMLFLQLFFFPPNFNKAFRTWFLSPLSETLPGPELDILFYAPITQCSSLLTILCWFIQKPSHLYSKMLESKGFILQTFADTVPKVFTKYNQWFPSVYLPHHNH